MSKKSPEEGGMIFQVKAGDDRGWEWWLNIVPGRRNSI